MNINTELSNIFSNLKRSFGKQSSSEKVVYEKRSQAIMHDKKHSITKKKQSKNRKRFKRELKENLSTPSKNKYNLVLGIIFMNKDRLDNVLQHIYRKRILSAAWFDDMGIGN